ncbi:hypothetical protein BKA59DRAFT_496835 [Fusarium tricinctum]|uniref:Alcohol dehydrogenase-like C-terminal domain-containing protein n=1 Tax=Fusarium tricinctum TaxID=61284 RepID=A0A8K0W7R1_9HYPO|nr:hypothetical protein BKA59DRAFT_496835 [Fusarium tricinctum]
MPYVIASDLVGEVVTVGPGEYSANFTPGEHVFGHTFAEGGSNNDFNGASGYGLPAPFSPEVKSFDLTSTTLLVIRGDSNTGRAVVKLAKLAGIGRIIAVTGRRNKATLESLGATNVIDRQALDVLDQIRAITGDELIYAVDTVNTGKGTLITLCRPEGEFSTTQIGSKSAGYERRYVFEVPRWLKEEKPHPSSFEVIKGLDADAINKALDQYRDGKGVKINIHP